MNDALIPNTPVSVERATQSAASMPTIPSGMSNAASRQSSALQDKPSARQTGFPRRSRRRRGSQGAQLLEFTLNFLPFMVMIIVLADTAWAIFAQATLQQA